MSGSWDKAIIAAAVVAVVYMVRQTGKDIAEGLSNLKFPDLPSIPNFQIFGGSATISDIQTPSANQAIQDSLRKAGYPQTTETIWQDEKTGVRVSEALSGLRKYELPGKWSQNPITMKADLSEVLKKSPVLDLPQFYDFDPLKVPVDSFTQTYNQTKSVSRVVEKPLLGSTSNIVRICDSPGRCVSQVINKGGGGVDRTAEFWNVVPDNPGIKRLENKYNEIKRNLEPPLP